MLHLDVIRMMKALQRKKRLFMVGIVPKSTHLVDAIDEEVGEGRVSRCQVSRTSCYE